MPTSVAWLGHTTFGFDTLDDKRGCGDRFLYGNPSDLVSKLELERSDLILLPQLAPAGVESLAPVLSETVEL